LNPSEIIEKLNHNLISGLTAISLFPLKSGSPDLASIIHATEYSLSFLDRIFRRRLGQIRKEMDWPETISDEEGAAQMAQSAVKSNENDTVCDFHWDTELGKLFWIFKFSNRKSLRIQDLVSAVFGLEYPSFSLARERLILQPLELSSNFLSPGDTSIGSADMPTGDV